MSTTVTYKGSTLTTVENETRTLTTRGKYLEDNITLVDETAPFEPELQTKSKTYTPTTSQQTESITADVGYDALERVNVTVNAVATAEYSVDIGNNDEFYNDGANRKYRLRPYLFVDGAGWVSSDTAGAWKNYSAVPSGTTITPSTSAQTVGGTKHMMEGAVTVNAIPSEYIIPSGNKAITENGTGIDVAQYETVSVNVSGGGGEPAPKKQINFIDYDGTIVESYTASEWANVTALPSNPSHTGLTAQGWNWTKAQIDAQLTAMPDSDVWVGQMYITDDGKTRIYIHLEEGRLHPYLGICPNGTVVVDWGDNSATATLTGTSLTTVKYADHEYASSGDYMITLTVSSGSFAFLGVANTSHILKKNTTTTGNIHRVYTNAVQKIELGIGANIGNYAFNYCCSLSSITIPNTVTSIGNYAFAYCYSLASVTIPSNASIGMRTFYYCYSLTRAAIPSNVTSIESSAFSNCASLSSVTIPSNVTSIGSSAFSNCYSLASITIPSNVTSIGSSAFNNCYSLASITIPSSVTSIGSSAFMYCYGAAEYHILPTTPPALDGTNVFSNISSDCVIYVPSASLETYKTASNWSANASYMQGE